MMNYKFAHAIITNALYGKPNYIVIWEDPVDAARYECGLNIQGRFAVGPKQADTLITNVENMSTCYVCNDKITPKRPGYWNSILMRPTHITCVGKTFKFQLSSMYGTRVGPGSAAIHEIDKVSSYPAVIQRGDK